MNLDFFILDLIQTHLRCGFLDTLMPAVTELGDGGIFFLLCAATLLLFPKTRRVGAAMAIGLVLEAVCCNLIVKPLVARPRPCDLRAVQLLIPRPGGFSFPSGHTAVAFTAAFSFYFSRSRLWLPALVLAALIAFSRLYLYVHYPTDVLAGAMLGVMVGWFACALVRLTRKFFSRRGHSLNS